MTTSNRQEKLGNIALQYDDQKKLGHRIMNNLSQEYKTGNLLNTLEYLHYIQNHIHEMISLRDQYINLKNEFKIQTTDH
mgnify:CR=1 FL=1